MALYGLTECKAQFEHTIEILKGLIFVFQLSTNKDALGTKTTVSINENVLLSTQNKRFQFYAKIFEPQHEISNNMVF